MTLGCSRSWELDALREGRLTTADAQSFARHMRTCSTCTELSARHERLRELGRAMPTGLPDEVTVRRVRGRILRAAATEIPSRRLRTLGVLAASVAIVVFGAWWALKIRPQPVHAVMPTAPISSVVAFAARVSPSPEARWRQERVPGPGGIVERIWLEDGTLVLEVRHQDGPERFVVMLPDGELEVRGTRFEVVVHESNTERVRVFEGRVALRKSGAPELLLGGGQEWPVPVAQLPAAPSVE
jgi:ferric-dicitrate binding protein FerR (iron transport regulator)